VRVVLVAAGRFVSFIHSFIPHAPVIHRPGARVHGDDAKTIASSLGRLHGGRCARARDDERGRAVAVNARAVEVAVESLVR